MKISRNKNIFLILILVFLALTLSIIKFKSSPGNLRTLADEFLIILNQPYLIKKDYALVRSDEIGKIIKNIIFSIKNIRNHKEYDEISIDTSFKNYLKIMQNRAGAINTAKNYNFLGQKTKVKGFIYYKDKKIPVKIRLKGDRADHWLSKKRFSLNIEVLGNNSLFGSRNLSLTNHLGRQFPENLLIAKSLKRNGLHYYNFETVKVKFNNENWGLMLIQEEISSDYFETRKMKETPTARFTNEEDRRLLSKLITPKISKNEVFNYTENQSFYEVNFKKEKKFLLNENSRNIMSFLKTFNIENRKYNNSRTIIDHYDIKKFAGLIAYSLAFRDLDNTKFTNIRFYFNPYSSKVEPIPNDFQISYASYENNEEFLKNIELFLKKNTFRIYLNLFNNKLFHNEIFNYLYLIKNDLIKIKYDLDELCFNFVACKDDFSLELIENNLNYLINNKKKITQIFTKLNKIEQSEVFKSVKILKKKVKNENIYDLEKSVIENLKNFIYYRIFDDGNFHLKNLSLFDINLEDIIFLDKNRNKIDCFKNLFKKINLKKEENIHLNYNLKNYCLKKNEQITVKVFYKVNGKKFEQTSFLENHKLASINNFKLINNSNDKIILTGNNFINKPIILNKNQDLIINKNTHIIFGPDAYILVDGGNFICLGNISNPTRLKSNNYNSYWNGILIKNSNKILIENCLIENTKEFRSYKKQFTSLTGGINIFNSKVTIINSTFKNSLAEDVLNIVSSNFDIINTKIINANSDGIDFDFSNGLIKNSEIQFIDGDGLDFSGSEVMINNLIISDIKDKGISIGERSNIEIKNTTIENSYIGIAVKDDSKLDLYSSKLINNTNDVSAYNKKSVYKYGGKIKIINSQIDKTKIKQDKLSSIIY